jgi:hypothetical protein
MAKKILIILMMCHRQPLRVVYSANEFQVTPALLRVQAGH